MLLVNNKFDVSNPISYEDKYYNQSDIKTQNFAQLESGIVLDYDSISKTGYVEYNNGKVRFQNLNNIAIFVGDTVVLSHVNKLETLVCLGVYSTDSTSTNPTTGVVSYTPTMWFRNTSTSTDVEVIYTSGTSYPTSKSYYTRSGKIISFYIEVDCTNITFGSMPTGQIKLELPVVPLYDTLNHFSGWAWDDISISPDLSNHIILNVDHYANTRTLDIHYLVEHPASPKPIVENLFTKAIPYALDGNSRIYVGGTYIAGDLQ